MSRLDLFGRGFYVYKKQQLAPPPPEKCDAMRHRTRKKMASVIALTIALIALGTVPMLAQTPTVTIIPRGNYSSTCSGADAIAGDRDCDWPGLQVDEGDRVEFVIRLHDVAARASRAISVSYSASGSAYNVDDLRGGLLGSTLSRDDIPSSAERTILERYPYNALSFRIARDADAGDEAITMTLIGVSTASGVNAYTIGTPSAATVVIRGSASSANSAPSFGDHAVTDKTFTGLNAAIPAFQLPAATGGNGALAYTALDLPAGLTLDDTGNGACSAPRTICGAPIAGETVRVTITATDEDADRRSSDEAILSFSITTGG